MKKKWELIKMAYDRYPAGACFNLMAEPGTQLSSGKFDFDGDDIYDVENKVWVYYLGKWATIVEADSKPDLLDGNVGIRVNDEHEFKALMKHYEEKGWKSQGGTTPSIITELNGGHPDSIWSYHDHFYALITSVEQEDYNILDFPDFAAHVGIEVRKPLLRSEDDVDLFEGDDYCLAICSLLGWQYVERKMENKVPNIYEKQYIFSTSEAAEAWVADKNRPKEVKISLYKDFRAVQFFSVVTKNDVSFYDESRKTLQLSIESDELEEIYVAHQKMQGGEHGA